jgi:catechol 2,3-dioxygenase-like lactoylglutathione lyase family enzyme
MKMLNHISIGVKDLAASGRFYDSAFEPLGYKRVFESAEYVCYGMRSPVFCVVAAKHPVPADTESGLHFCFDAARRADVNAFHRAAIAAGGRDNGAPGLRKDYGDDYYAAFVIDPDGYRLEAYTTASQ